MNPRAARLEALFDAAFDLDAADRARFIETVDPSLREDLIKLLEADAFTSPVDKPPPGMAQAAAVFCLPEEIQSTISSGQQIGHYRLIRLLGEGGMASVWLAQRDDGTFNHQVAVKCLKTGLGTPESRNRFLHEQQILAQLQHPNIARLYDAGISSDGVPFIVMEWVDGGSLTQYCDQHQLSVRKRLELFQKIASAVAYSHQNLIVHRDIKPNNILIGLDGEPKLLDFGIAKSLNDPSAPMTRTGLHLLTPEYAAPEQFSGAAITTATDVYALGAVLYELVSGLRPRIYIQGQVVDITTPVTAPSEALKRGSKPPSSKETANPGQLAKARASGPDRLSRLLAGDLDTLILKALQSDPNRRYATAQALSEDIDRYLHQQPIHARKDAWSYRTRKFLQRHAGAAALTALVTLALLLATGISVYQARRAQMQTERAELEAQHAQDEAKRAHSETERAQTEAKRAAAVKDFLSNLFEVSDVGLPRTEVPTTETLLQDGAKRIRNEFNDEPELKLDLLLLIAKIQTNLGLYEPAESLLKDASEIAETKLSPAHERWLQTQTQSAALLLKRSQGKEADEKLAAAIAQYRNAGGLNTPALAEALANQGHILAFFNHFDEGIAATQESLNIFKQLFGDYHPQVQKSLQRLGTALKYAKRWDEAEAVLRANVLLSRQLYGERHAAFANSLGALAELLEDQDKNSEAEALLHQELAINEMVYDRPNSQLVSTLMQSGDVLTKRHRLDEAQLAYQRALEIQRKLIGSDDWTTGKILSKLGFVALRRGHHAEAGRILQPALQIIRNHDSTHSLEETAILEALGFVYVNQKQYKKGIAMLQEALAINQFIYGKDSDAVAISLANLALTEIESTPRAKPNTNTLVMALEHVEDAVRIVEKWFDADSKRMLEIRAIKGIALSRLARYQDAKDWFTPLIEHMRKVGFPATTPYRFEECLVELGYVQLALHETAAALASWDETLALMHQNHSSKTEIAEVERLIASAHKTTISTPKSVVH